MALNIQKFISVTTQLAFQASRIIRDVHESGDLHKVMKGFNDPVTEADIKVQTMIMNGLRTYWPSLKIVGEESTTFKGELFYDFMQFSNPFLPHHMQGFEHHKEEELSLEDSCVWLDPLDGTKSYTNGELDEVTTLIGLSYRKKARIGIMGIPYVRIAGGYKFNPRVLVGDVGNPGVFEVTQNLQWRPVEGRKPGAEFSLVTTKNDLKPQQLHLMEGLTKNILKTGGSGKKISMVLYGEADSMVYLGARTSMWDICAGEALIKAAGGQFTTTDGKEMEYDHTSNNFLNKGGVVCSMDTNLQTKLLESTSQYK